MLNNYSCLVDALAVLLCEDPYDIAVEIGYDGSEVWWPYLPDPLRRRGFHYQELLDVCARRGCLLLYVERTPLFYPHESSLSPREMENRDVLDERFNQWLLSYPGIAVGKNLDGNRHAVAWEGGTSDNISLYMPFVRITNEL